tara:strand:- start:1646 stop:2245 length:600 start_codon:yes stop_codon:yes gene_type:complete
MAEKKIDSTLEREYTIPLRNQWKRVPRYKKANKAIRAIKEFLAKHMKIRDRDLKKIKIDSYLNEEIWFRGIRKPPAKIKVKAIKEGDNVKVKLAEVPEKFKFKKLREEKMEQKAAEILESKKKTLDKLKEQAQGKKEEKKSDTEEKKEEAEGKKEEAKEKKSAVVESTEKMEKDLAKKAKHETKQSKQPKRQQRKALAK